MEGANYIQFLLFYEFIKISSNLFQSSEYIDNDIYHGLKCSVSGIHTYHPRWASQQYKFQPTKFNLDV